MREFLFFFEELQMKINYISFVSHTHPAATRFMTWANRSFSLLSVVRKRSSGI
jgi:hypothetical protein